MTSRTIPIRLEDDLIARIDALAALLTKRAAGVKVARTAAMRTALERGLEALETEVGKPARRKPQPRK